MKFDNHENTEEPNVTILRAKLKLNKSYYLNDNRELQSKPKVHAKYFGAESLRFDSIYDIWDVLKVICEEPYISIIRGIADEESMDSTRRIKDIFKEPVGGSPWVMLDLDKVDIGKRSPITPASIEYAIQNHLPEEFHDVTYVYQFSNSAGFQDYNGGKKGMNVHLYFYLDRCVLNDELKKWLKDCYVDKSLFTPVQPHYTALPSFDGLTCKVKKRQALVRKNNDIVKVPEIELDPVNPLTGRRKKPVDNSKIIWETKTKDVQVFNEIFNEVSSREGLDFSITDVQEDGAMLKGTCPYGSLHSVGDGSDSSFNVYITNKGRVYSKCRHTSCEDSLTRLNAILNEEWKVRDSSPYYDQSSRVDLDTAESKLQLLVQRYSENPVDMIIKADCSLGKTKEIIELVIDADKLIHYSVPNHKLAKELAERVSETHSELKTVVIKGRGQEGMCMQAHLTTGKKNKDGTACKLIDELPAKGKSVYDSLCRKTVKDADNGTDLAEYCEFYSNCEYIRQYSEAVDASLVIMTHDALVIDAPKSLRLADPDLLIIDESFWQIFSRFDSIALSDLKNYKGYSSEARVLNAVADACYKQEPLLRYLRSKGITKDDIEIAMSGVIDKHRGYSFCSINPEMPDAEKVKQYKGIKKKIPYYDLLRCLFLEFDMGRDYAHSVTYKGTTIQLQYRTDLKRYFSVPTLIIDADADKGLIERCFGKGFEFEEIKVKMKESTKVTQCHSSSFYTNSMVQHEKKSEKNNKAAETLITEINEFIEEKSKNGKKVLVVAPLKVEKQLKISESCESEHFNSFLGLDKYSSFDVVIDIGRNQMPTADLERIGKAMYFDDEQELELTSDGYLSKERRRYSTKGTAKSRTAIVQYHPDKRIDRILKQTRENQIVQAVNRIRPLRGAPKEIIILSNLPVDMEIGDLVDWKTYRTGGTKIDKMLKSIDFDTEVIPFTYDYFIKRFNNLWTTKGQFRSALRSSSVVFRSLLVSIIENNTRLNSHTFKLLGSQSNYLPVLTPYVFSVTKQKLEEMYGCEVDLKPNKTEPDKENNEINLYDLIAVEAVNCEEQDEICKASVGNEDINPYHDTKMEMINIVTGIEKRTGLEGVFDKEFTAEDCKLFIELDRDFDLYTHEEYRRYKNMTIRQDLEDLYQEINEEYLLSVRRFKEHITSS